MTMGTQCDTCRRFAPSAPAGWFVLARVEEQACSGILSVLSGTVSQPEQPATFCSPRCLADYACVLAAAGSAGSAP